MGLEPLEPLEPLEFMGLGPARFRKYWLWLWQSLLERPLGMGWQPMGLEQLEPLEQPLGLEQLEPLERPLLLRANLGQWLCLQQLQQRNGQ